MNVTLDHIVSATRYFAVAAICLAIGAHFASANPYNRTPERFGPDRKRSICFVMLTGPYAEHGSAAPDKRIAAKRTHMLAAHAQHSTRHNRQKINADKRESTEQNKYCKQLTTVAKT